MSLDFKLTNNNLINYARTDDAHEAFVNSVGNGQARLALEVLVDLINGIVDKLEELDLKINPSVEAQVSEITEQVDISPVQIEEQVKPKAKQPKIDQSVDKEADVPS